MRALLVLSLLVAAACAPTGPPARNPDILGVITRMPSLPGGRGGDISNDGNTILVEEDPSDTAGSAKASVAIDGNTRVWNVVGPGVVRIDAGKLKVGLSVRVWFDGPVAMSYPVQGRAADIAMELTSGETPRLEILSKGAAPMIVRIDGAEAARVPCNGGVAVRPGEHGVPALPWDLQVVDQSNGRVLLDQRVTQLPQWLLVQGDSAGLSASPIIGPFVPCS